MSEGQRSEKKADTEGFEQSFEKMLGMIQEKEGKEFTAINEQISNFAQTYPTNLKASSNEALLFMRRYRF
ncbi:MAG: hypothetical protein KHX44_05430, partial [Blautia sp.]|nr:hypothetical protein [Blautia sp.]